MCCVYVAFTSALGVWEIGNHGWGSRKKGSTASLGGMICSCGVLGCLLLRPIPVDDQLEGLYFTKADVVYRTAPAEIRRGLTLKNSQ